MAPIKFEENIREKLQERELQPKEGAWEKLEAQLGETSEKKKPSYFWMAVAASFVGVLLVGSWFFFNKEDATTELVNEDPIKVEEENLFVEETNNTTPLQQEEQITVSEDDKVVPSQEEVVVQTPENNTKENAVAVNDIPKKEAVLQKKDEEKVIPVVPTSDEGIAAQQDLKKEGNIEGTAVAKLDEETFIQQKVDEVIQEVKKIQEENSSVSVAEIDALLAKAQRDIATKRILNSDQRKVDAQALLMDVEIELERSFRDRVFQALGEGFNKVKTAVVERNN